MKFKAIDGREFDTYDECVEYESNPLVYVIKMIGFGSSEPTAIFLTKEEAELYKKDKLAEAVYGGYLEVKPLYITKYQPKKKYSASLNMEVEQPLPEEVEQKREGLLNKLRQFICG